MLTMQQPPGHPNEPAPKLFTALYANGFHFPRKRPHPFIWVLHHSPTNSHVVLGYSCIYHCFFLKGNPHLSSFRLAQHILSQYENANV